MARSDATQGVPALCDAIVESIELYLGKSDLGAWYKTEKKEFNAQSLLTALLTHWSQISAKPTVLLLDEVDALVGDTLISLLRQIRAGYAQRPEAFPQSIVLYGVRDVITGGSAFNIKAKSLRMGNFSQQETIDLLQQHTTETGQVFEPGVLDELWLDSKGQPWLVNALAHQLTWECRPARETLIYSRATHLDQLIDKLKEPRVHSVISAMLSGDEELMQINPHDIEYVQDLGLIDVSRSSGIKISNRIYQEVIPRELVWSTQMMISNQEQVWYITPDRHIDTPKLLAAFQQFFRELSIPVQRIVLQEAITQTQGYAHQVGATEAHLIIFDRNPNTTWRKKIWRKVVDGVPVWGC